MKIRLSNTLVLSIILILSGLTDLYAQCKITAPTTKLCRGNSVTFSVSATASSYLWNSGDGKTENKQTATFLYDHDGVFKLQVVLFNPDNTIKCKDSLFITVFDLPNANMLIGDTVETCFNKSYCFINISTKGANNSPITQYLWLFGDGDISNLINPCHYYDYSGDYLIFLNVKDANNCESKLEKKVHVTVGTSMRPRFDIIATDSCPVTNAWFINKTDTTGKKIRKFIMDFADGDKDSSITKRNFFHTYIKDSSFIPSLTVINYLGCKETFYPYDSVVNTVLNFNFNITANPQITCWTPWPISFNQPVPKGRIQKLLWTFGDPMSTHNYNTVSLDPSHFYVNPGIYDISLHIESSYCVRDTTLCRFVWIKGPKARINLPDVTNYCLDNRPMPRSIFYDASSICLNPKGDSIAYTRLMKVPKYIRSTVDTYCYADTIGIYTKKNPCRTDTVYTLKPSGIKNIYDTISIFYDYWYPGDPIPSGQVYYPPSGKCNPNVMHDTDFYPSNCGAPNYVRFTNNTIKFRKYAAIDDVPPFASGTLGSDQCKNPSYPWASDSLQYLWDFGDDYAPKCTSTKTNININCRYSTEVAPWHLYNKDGCFKASLSVYDPVTKCSSVDSLKITMQKPDAGWDTSAYDYLNYRLQFLKPPYIARRGLLLRGSECINDFQRVDISEVLPDCNVQDWGIVFDSVSDCSSLCTDTSFVDTDNDGNLDTIIHNKVSCKWITKVFYEDNYPTGYLYKTTGCKTVGFWVKSGECVDTFWYHSYKNIVEVADPRFSLMDQDSLKLMNQKNFCPPFKPAFTAFVKNQDCIIDFKYEILKRGYPDILLFRDSSTLAKDTAYLLTNKFYPLISFYYPSCTCPDDPLNNMKLQDLLKDFFIKDTVYILSLEDTILSNYTIKDSGLIEIRSYIRSTNGCGGMTSMSFRSGLDAYFNAWDSILCVNDTTSFFTYARDHNNLFFYSSNVDYDFNGDGVYDSGQYYRYNKPGVYTVSMRVTDTICNITQVYTKKNYIYVEDVQADFDTLNSPSNCAPQVVGFVDKSRILNAYYFIYDTLGNKIDSSLFDQIINRVWDFGDHKGSNSISFKESPKHAYTANGEFDVSLMVVSALGCRDTILKPKYIKIDGPKPAFNLLDTIGCVPFTARFIDTSNRVSSWIWQLGDNSQSSGFYKFGDTVSLTYNRVGVFYPNLIGTDSVYNVYLNTYTKCTSIYPDPLNPDAKRFKVTVLPISILKFTGDTILCSGEEGFYTDLSDTAYNQILWDFGDSNILQANQGAKVSHTYTIPEDQILGKFILTHDGDGSICPDIPKSKVVTVKRVIADIVWDSSLNTDPIFCFRNYTKGGTKYNWYFKDGTPYFLKANDTDYQCTNYYLNQGIKTVCMKAENEIGCKDEDCAEVENNYDVLINIPNVFTPGNNDMRNDTFTIASKNIELYYLTIYNRWGSVVFKSSDPNIHWNGNDFIKNKPCSPGTYYYVLEYKFKHLAVNSVSGTITLIR